MTRNVFEVSQAALKPCEIPPQSPLVESMFAIAKCVRDCWYDIQNPERAQGNFDAQRILADISMAAKTEIPYLRGGEAEQAKKFFAYYASVIEIAMQTNFFKIRALHAGSIPDRETYGNGNWPAVLTRWKFLVDLKNLIRKDFLPTLEKIIAPPPPSQGILRA